MLDAGRKSLVSTATIAARVAALALIALGGIWLICAQISTEPGSFLTAVSSVADLGQSWQRCSARSAKAWRARRAKKAASPGAQHGRTATVT